MNIIKNVRISDEQQEKITKLVKQISKFPEAEINMVSESVVIRMAIQEGLKVLGKHYFVQKPDK